MPRSRSERSSTSGVHRVRTQFLTALQTGRLRPGDRVPSIRRLADLTGLNRKTVHRAYARLAEDGLLDIRRGSGTYLAEVRDEDNANLAASELLAAINHARSQAASLGLQPSVFARFLDLFLGSGMRGLSLAVVECNREQVGLIAQEVHRHLGATPRPVLLADLAALPRTMLQGARAVVTTDCHRAEVEAVAGPRGYSVYRVALDLDFPRTLAEYARRGPVLMVIRDAAYGPIFLRLLRRLRVPSELLDRFHVVEPDQLPLGLRRLGGQGAVYLSPLVEAELSARVPPSFSRVEVRRHMDLSSFERLRSRLALDLAMDEKRN